MRFLHTSDWHLGQKLLYHDREEEHELALKWLLQTIADKEVEALIVSGDVFDIGNPSNQARRLYYGFLYHLLQSTCRHVIVTGGNHDSPLMLDAPRDLLQLLHMHVTGAAPTERAEQLIELRRPGSGELEAVVAAVPFLRDRDLRYGVAGESAQERIARIREGIKRHYQELADLAAERFGGLQIPLMATGHLYVQGAFASDRQDNIYIGDVENIRPEEFPDIFSYVALGHIHRAQVVGEKGHVRYSGSLIPLSFSETKDEKGVYLIDFEGRDLKDIQFVPAPGFRRLKTIRGDLESVKQALARFNERGGRQLTPWVEVVIESAQIIPQLDVLLKEFTVAMDLELLKIRLDRGARPAWEEEDAVDLQDLDTLDVFRKKCERYGCQPEELAELEQSFRELQTWMKENNEE